MAAFTLTKETEITLQWRVLTYDEEPKKDEDGEVSFYRCAFLKRIGENFERDKCC